MNAMNDEIRKTKGIKNGMARESYEVEIKDL
jgi:hypothetical protein